MTRREILRRRAATVLVATGLAAALATPSLAELIRLEDAVRAPVAISEGNPFAARLYVNGLVITEYDLAQRAIFMRALRAPGDPAVEALKALIDDRLRTAEARRLGLKLTSEQVLAGMNEFAARANLTPEQFVQALAQEGIDQAAFEDFIRSGLIWREVVRARYAGMIPATESEIDEALNSIARTGTEPVQVEYAEAVIPDNAAEIARIRAAVDRCIDLYGPEAGLSSSQVTLTTRTVGAIPSDVAAVLAGLDPGEISTALTRGGARVLVMLCNRSPVPQAPPPDPEADPDAPPPEPVLNRAAIREQVIGLKAEGLAGAYLEELRAAALIRTP